MKVRRKQVREKEAGGEGGEGERVHFKKKGICSGQSKLIHVPKELAAH